MYWSSRGGILKSNGRLWGKSNTKGNQLWSTSIEQILRDSPGRPAFSISKQVLERFVENRFNVSAMVSVLKVCESTVKRLLCNYEISIYWQYQNLSEADLDAVVMYNWTGPKTWLETDDWLYFFKKVRGPRKRWMRESVWKVDPERVIKTSVSLK